MKTAFSCALLTALSLAPLRAEPVANGTATTLPEAPVVVSMASESGPSQAEDFSFIGEDVTEVLQVLARKAKIQMVIAQDVHGPVNLKLSKKKPMEVIDILVRSQDLTHKVQEGVHHISSKHPRPPVAKAEKPTEDGIDNLVSVMVVKGLEASLDFQARPETAVKMAKGKKQYYDALIAEGFSKDEAFRLVLFTHIPHADDLPK